MKAASEGQLFTIPLPTNFLAHSQGDMNNCPRTKNRAAPSERVVEN